MDNNVIEFKNRDPVMKWSKENARDMIRSTRRIGKLYYFNMEENSEVYNFLQDQTRKKNRVLNVKKNSNMALKYQEPWQKQLNLKRKMVTLYSKIISS